MTKNEALRLALEALEYFSDTSPNMAGKAHAEDAITAIKAALEAKDEPVAWNLKDVTDAYKLGTKSLQRKPLTDEEIWACLPKDPDEMAFARAIEAAHGIKGENA